jgi:glc operon protein GlcG
MNLVALVAVSAPLFMTSVALAQQSPSPPPAPPLGPPVTYEQARKVAEAARVAAVGIMVPNAIAVVEPSGELVYFMKMDGAPYSAIELAQQKAVVAARYRRPTKSFFDAVEGGHPFFLTFPGIVAVPGGLPIVVDGKLIGAIGVSGGDAQQDVLVSNAGALALP